MIKKFFIFPLLALLAILPQIHAQVILDTGFGSNSGFEQIALGDDGASGSQSLTVSSNSGRMLVAFVQSRHLNDRSETNYNTLSYGDDDFSLLGEVTDFDGSNGFIVTRAYYLANPSSGTNDLVYDIQNAALPEGSLGGRGYGLSVFSFENAGGIRELDADNGSGTSSTVSGTVSADSMILSGLTSRDPALDITNGGTGQTVAYTDWVPTSSSSSTRAITAAGYESITSAGSDSIAWNLSAGQNFAHYGVEITVIPEPSAAMLLLGGLSVMLLIRRRR